ncbi:insulin-like growth factor-binding protein-related protein 1 [Penaeus vannamei]|uniref:Single IB domain protein n=1 Tax=Penaeus vannamei TaxID=6689 RepID=B6S691_PENVA|nr:insulin-like growth factor-binding protein-related protein 1 [Penaeus vannamei]XP_027221414.1 insulin-like growth factor-binding protein-related protein 1 [Penaeus vannamei]XP_027221415.1 insulin-like growth factor-binding protein-related protein 1 [Penaeus vannamei]ACF93414.1 single IB domain protein [Penaeus vannamei]
MKTLPLLLLLACACATTSGFSVRCSPCDEVDCGPPPADCKYGLVKNVCNCCYICGKGPGEDCDPVKKCAPGLYCKLHPVSYGNGICTATPQKWY